MNTNNEPRTHLDMMRDLVAALRDREWIQGHVWCGDGYDSGCSECEALTPTKEGEGHKPGCKTAALLVEAEAFLRVEGAIK
jgi:hypothetical protein